MQKKSNKALFIFFVLSIVFVLLSSLWYTQTIVTKDSLTIKTDSLRDQVEKQEQSDSQEQPKKIEKNMTEIEKVYKGDDVDKLKKQLEKLKKEYTAKSTKREDLSRIAKLYIEGKYNHKYGEGNDVIVPRIESYITKGLADRMKNEKPTAPKGNMISKTDSIFKVERVYSSDVYRASTNNNYSGQDTSDLPFFCETFVKGKSNFDLTEIYSVTLVYTDDGFKVTGDTLLSVEKNKASEGV